MVGICISIVVPFQGLWAGNPSIHQFLEKILNSDILTIELLLTWFSWILSLEFGWWPLAAFFLLYLTLPERGPCSGPAKKVRSWAFSSRFVCLIACVSCVFLCTRSLKQPFRLLNLSVQYARVSHVFWRRGFIIGCGYHHTMQMVWFHCCQSKTYVQENTLLYFMDRLAKCLWYNRIPHSDILMYTLDGLQIFPFYLLSKYTYTRKVSKAVCEYALWPCFMLKLRLVQCYSSLALGARPLSG